MLQKFNRGSEICGLALRQLTAGLRCLPNTVIIGAQKSGTSSLFSYLVQHPEIQGSFRKEVHYFDGGLVPNVDNFKKGQSWYRAHFPLRGKKAETPIIEATPSYLFVPSVPDRISSLLPDAKFIAVLRNPVDRAISHYFHEVRAGREKRPIMTAIVEEEKVLDPIWKSQDYNSLPFFTCSYKARGRYAEQLARYHKHFSSDNVLVLSSKALFASTDETLSRIFRFLGVEESGRSVKDQRPKNVGSNKSPVDPSVQDYLSEYFVPHNEKLFELLEEELVW